MRTLRDLSLNQLQIKSSLNVASALLAMQQAGVSAAAVTKKGEFIGIVTIEACILSDSDAPIKSILRSMPEQAQISEGVRRVAKSFVKFRCDNIAVFDQNKFQGLLSAHDIITELGRSWDPLTGLSWSDRLRDWGVDSLEAGVEISIIFFDLNDFGIYNKKFGHTIGDKVIIEFGKLLTEIVDPQKDVLVRYGGDEFAIGTTRSRTEVLELLRPLESRKFNLKDLPQAVGFCYGISGGKRTQEPSRDHVAATLDNLINLASKDCLASKPRIASPTAVIQSQETAKINKISLNYAGPRNEDPDTIRIELEKGDLSTRVDQTFTRHRFKTIALATAQALSDLEPSLKITIDQIAFGIKNGERAVILSGTVAKENGRPIKIYSESHLNGDVDRSIANCVLEAVEAFVPTS